MKVLLPYEVVQKLAAELKRAGIREIGGVLVGSTSLARHSASLICPFSTAAAPRPTS